MPFTIQEAGRRTLPLQLQSRLAADVVHHVDLIHGRLSLLPKATFAQFATVHYHQSVQMGKRTLGKPMFGNVLKIMAAHLAEARFHKLLFPSACSRSHRLRRIALDRMAQSRNAPFAWRSTRSGSHWYVSSAYANSTSGALWSGLSERKSVRCTRHPRPVLAVFALIPLFPTLNIGHLVYI